VCEVGTCTLSSHTGSVCYGLEVTSKVCVVFIFGKCWEYKPCIKQELEFQVEFCEGGGGGMTVAMV